MKITKEYWKKKPKRLWHWKNKSGHFYKPSARKQQYIVLACKPNDDNRNFMIRTNGSLIYWMFSGTQEKKLLSILLNKTTI